MPKPTIARIIVDCEQSLLHQTSPIYVKDWDLLEYIKTLYRQSRMPIIIVTANPKVQLIADCLCHVMPKSYFTLLYAPPLNNIKEKEMAHETEELKITSGIPSLGYNLLFNH